MIVWRIDKAKRSRDASFSGDGARLHGGRWNKPGTRVVYAAESLALAALESFVQIGMEGREIKYVAYKVTIPASVRVETFEGKLPNGWRAYPPPAGTLEIGSAWAEQGSAVALRVPSVIVPSERNVLLNPAHADFAELRISDPEPFTFDERLWK